MKTTLLLKNPLYLPKLQTFMQLKNALVISLIEGGVLMAYEIIASKLYTPLIGNSIYVWTSILSVTLLGLALGYRKGDKVKINQNILFKNLLICALYLLVIPYVYIYVLTPLIHFDIRILSLMTGVVILLIPMYLLGQVSPILIRIISAESKEKIGFNSGLIYFIGTLGGIILSLITIFIFIDLIGVKKIILSLSAFLFIAALIAKFKLNEKV